MPNWFRRAAKAPPAATLGSLEISQPWARSASASSLEGGGFFTLVNKGGAADRLIAASSPAAERIEIHAIKVVGGDIEMRPLENGLAIHPGSTATFKPRGYHLLLIGLKAPLGPGGAVPVTLTFEKAGSIDIELAVAAPGPVGRAVLDEEGQQG